jgi:hypothetical protein
MRDFLKAKPPVQIYTGFIGRIDPGYNGMHIVFLGRLDQGRHQQFPDPLSPLIRGYVNGILHGVFLSGPGAKGPVGAKAYNLIF